MENLTDTTSVILTDITAVILLHNNVKYRNSYYYDVTLHQSIKFTPVI